MALDPRFNMSNFYSTTEDGQSLDLLGAKFNNLAMLIPSSRTIVVNSSAEANLPFLADKYMGTSSLFWAIAMFNGIIDPINDVYIGRRLLIPARSAIISLLEAGSRSNVTSVEI